MKAFSTFVLVITMAFGTAWSQESRNINFTSLCWSPDGRQLVFSAIAVRPDWSDYDEANWRLLLYDVKTGGFERVEDGATFGAIAPDGCRIAYQKTEDETRDIFLENRCTGQRKNLTDHPARDGVPAFSPDGRKLAFNSDRNGGIEIFVLDLENPDAPPAQITHAAPHKSYNPEWSPDGKQFVYYLEKGDGKDQIWLTDIAGRSPRNISNDTLHSYYPAWTPGGEIIFTSTDDQIFAMHPDGSSRKPLPGVASFFARVSPKKNRIAYISRDDGGIVIAKYPRLKRLTLIDGEQLQGKGFW
jgi:Tol biopolymer transport system component